MRLHLNIECNRTSFKLRWYTSYFLIAVIDLYNLCWSYHDWQHNVVSGLQPDFHWLCRYHLSLNLKTHTQTHMLIIYWAVCLFTHRWYQECHIKGNSGSDKPRLWHSFCTNSTADLSSTCLHFQLNNGTETIYCSVGLFYKAFTEHMPFCSTLCSE